MARYAANTAHSGELAYWVVFDSPQYDSDGCSPYCNAHIWDRYLKPLLHRREALVWPGYAVPHVRWLARQNRLRGARVRWRLGQHVRVRRTGPGRPPLLPRSQASSKSVALVLPIISIPERGSVAGVKLNFSEGDRVQMNFLTASQISSTRSRWR